jgi:hypothetical protein
VGQAARTLVSSTHAAAGQAARKAARQARRVGWKVEDKLDDGLRLARRHPGKATAIVVAVVATLGLCVLLRRSRRS